MDIFPTRILLATDGSEDAALATRAAACPAQLAPSFTSSMPGSSRLPILPIQARY